MTDPLVRLLADGAFHSGADIAVTLGISRAAVWKQVQRLSELGLDVHAVRGKGYRIPGGLDLLDPVRIMASLPVTVAARIGSLDVFDTVDSTNAAVVSGMRAGRGSPVCLAERQTAGRGRRGRTWASPFAANVYLSLVHEFAGGAAVVEGLSLAVGVAACESLRSLGAGEVMLKWPNDLVARDRKLGGILIELGGDLHGNCRAVIGIGVNVRMPAAAAVDIGQPWVDLQALRPGIPRNEVVVALLSSILPSVRLFEDEGLSPFIARWEAFDACRGRRVVITGAGEDVEGIEAGIDERGGIRLETAGGVRVFRGGEVSLRGWAGRA